MPRLQETISRAETNLQRKLEWISRYDTRVIFVASIAIAMLGVLASASGNLKEWSCLSLFSFGASFILLIISLTYVYLAQRPKITSPNQSLLFFGTISKLKFTNFSDQFKNSTDEEYLNDLLHQIHINSIVLCKKFRYLRYSIFSIGLAVIPWGSSVYFSKLYLN
ncbi:Pycsar system effector family protein [Sphingobacterium sp. UBA5980]|uniref:Pycsar system effector family protein n=1 Tax=Sphingobacterium sp. UBA5980 TaxID=1947504 RepID=UPI00257A5AC3|nr:Pycsar system effector family protein [Sphingobacterium sp. UBA5980]